jgi:type IV fimbrial biogenesis protein FimT
MIFTLVVLAVLMALAAPSLTNLVRDQRIKTVTGDIYGAMAFARSEAIKRNVNVAVCSHNGGGGCQNSTDWALGWIVYLDADGNGFPGAASDLLKTQDALTDIAVTGNVAKMSYVGDGRVRRDMPGEPANALPTFVASIPGNDSITVRCVRLDLGGRPNIQVDTNKAVPGCQ